MRHGREGELYSYELSPLLPCVWCRAVPSVRAEVPGAIRDCQRAGIAVRMITGDNVTKPF
jgi:hypothetical protein